jgi:hypothetical protein
LRIVQKPNITLDYRKQQMEIFRREAVARRPGRGAQ